MSTSNVQVGAFTPYTSKIDPQAAAAFKEALEGMVGVRYSAVAVSQQVVAGMNYKFFCNAEPSTPNPIHQAAIVSVYKPLEGQAHVTGISPIH